MSDGVGKYTRLLKAAMQNLSQSFHDDFEKSNSKFRAEAGLEVLIIREELGECCSWCADLAGVYQYESAPSDVWARHENCCCMVSTKTKRGTFQDAWNRKEYESLRENRIAREQELVTELKAKEIERKKNIFLEYNPEKDTQFRGKRAEEK